MRVASDRLQLFLERLLDRSGLFQALSEDTGEKWLWENHELASLVENRLGALLDPAAVDDARRAELAQRLSTERSASPTRAKRYWLLDGRRRVGTIAIDVTTRPSIVEVASVYVVPRARREGHAGRALLAIRSAAWRADLEEIRLNTEWSWTAAVRLYQSLGMWLARFDAALELVWRRALPAFAVTIEGRHARFCAGQGESRHLWLRAERLPSHTDWHAPACAHHLAPPTFALALAAQGWPLRGVQGADGSGADRARALARALERSQHSEGPGSGPGCRAQEPPQSSEISVSMWATRALK